MLQPLGVSTAAEALYVRIARMTDASIDSLLVTDEDRGIIPPLLEELRQLGLIIDSGPNEVRALPLDDAVKAIKERRVAEIESAVRAAETMNLQLWENRGNAAGIEVLIGPERANATYSALCRQTQFEIAGFDRPPYMFTRKPTIEYLRENSSEFQALQRGVKLRSVYHPGFDRNRLSELTMFMEHGEMAKLGDVPMKLMLFDKRTAILPAPRGYAPDEDVKATVVRHPVVVDALVSLFEAIWERSIAIRPTHTGGLQEDPRRDALVSLLMSGATDSAIASQFGVTERSVRRWIAELMEELDVRTRLQLGAALAKSQSFRRDNRQLV